MQNIYYNTAGIIGMRNFILIYIILLLTSTVFCNSDKIINDDNDIIVYPVPFNSDGQSVLKISYPNGVSSPVLDSLALTVFDIDGDEIVQKNYSVTTLAYSNPVIWNGRNDLGNLVSPGEYTLKLVTENSQTGYYSRSFIDIIIH